MLTDLLAQLCTVFRLFVLAAAVMLAGQRCFSAQQDEKRTDEAKAADTQEPAIKEDAEAGGEKDAAEARQRSGADTRKQRGADAPPRVGTLIRLEERLTERLDTRIRRAVSKAIRKAKEEGNWPVIIFEMRSVEAEFGKALDLARYLASSNLNGATTVAYIPESLTGHAVLVALACDEIIMGEEAQLGDAGKSESVINASERSAYAEIANSRRTVPADVALKMLDPSVDLRLVETDVSREFVRADRLPELRKEKSIAKEVPLIPAGKPGLFNGERARELGFVSYLANDRQAVAKALGLPASAVEEDLALGGAVRPVLIAVKGPISAALTDQIQNVVQTQIHDHDVNLLCFRIESPGGSPNDSINLANYLNGINAAERRTVAYIPTEARGDAAYIALACDQIVMRPQAVLGGSGAAELAPDERETVARSVAAIAEQKHRSPALAAAMVESKVPVFQYTRQADGLIDFLTEEQAAKLPDAKAWQRGERVVEPGKILLVDGEKSEQLGLAHAVVTDFAGLKALYGLEEDPALVEPGWADFLIDALNSPGVSFFLLFLGAAALYAELQSPGIGLGGLIAALCFLLFFWSAYLGGTAGWLEVLLFLAGVTCLALEIFVLPGVGLFGLAGGLLVITSLILASQTFVLPRNDYQLHHLRNSLLMLIGAGIAVVAAAATMRRFLPHTPVLNNMVLAPPSSEEVSRINEREALARLEHLQGRRGVAFTPLVPGGKARIGDELVDVLTDGEFVDRGLPIEVIEVRGNRVVVRGLS
ncbi:MAG TPA: NfeD family protein [Pirellulales bacterium]|nr:NfeD family protein [Pirellulales bacterium]